MTTTLTLALQITLVGMGLVFAAILLLWLLMSALVRLTAARRKVPAGPTEPGSAAQADDRAARAAAAAVAAALAAQGPAQPRFPLPPTALVSAWQAVRRSAQLNRRGPVR